MNSRFAKLLIVILSLSGTQVLFQNCSQEMQGNSVFQDSSSSGDVGGDSWIVGNVSFVEGSGSSYDLNSTLPAGTPSSGTFSVDPSGTQLPQGMTLSAAGILAVGNAAIGDTAGVVFVYDTGP
ncbi:MAG: hypothetical protein AB7N80_05220 [Bdellovibrionales bacterium]